MSQEPSKRPLIRPRELYEDEIPLGERLYVGEAWQKGQGAFQSDNPFRDQEGLRARFSALPEESRGRVASDSASALTRLQDAGRAKVGTAGFTPDQIQEALGDMESASGVLGLPGEALGRLGPGAAGFVDNLTGIPALKTLYGDDVETTADARSKVRKSVTGHLTGFTPDEQDMLEKIAAADYLRELHGEEPQLSPEQRETLAELWGEGWTSHIAGIAETLGVMGGSGLGWAGNVAGKAATAGLSATQLGKAAPWLARALGAGAGEAAAFGATENLMEGELSASPYAFGFGMGAAGATGARRLLEAQVFAKNAITKGLTPYIGRGLAEGGSRFVGRTAAEGLKIRSGRLAESLLRGEPVEGLTQGWGEDAILSAGFAGLGQLGGLTPEQLVAKQKVESLGRGGPEARDQIRQKIENRGDRSWPEEFTAQSGGEPHSDPRLRLFRMGRERMPGEAPPPAEPGAGTVATHYPERMRGKARGEQFRKGSRTSRDERDAAAREMVEEPDFYEGVASKLTKAVQTRRKANATGRSLEERQRLFLEGMEQMRLDGERDLQARAEQAAQEAALRAKEEVNYSQDLADTVRGAKLTDRTDKAILIEDLYAEVKRRNPELAGDFESFKSRLLEEARAGRLRPQRGDMLSQIRGADVAARNEVVDPRGSSFHYVHLPEAKRAASRDPVVDEGAIEQPNAEMRGEIRDVIKKRGDEAPGISLLLQGGKKGGRAKQRAQAIERGVSGEEFDAEFARIESVAKSETQKARKRIGAAKDIHPKLSERGKQKIAEFLGWTEATHDIYTPKELREHFTRKLEQEGSWLEPLRSMTPESRLAEAQRAIVEANKYLGAGGREKGLRELEEASKRDEGTKRGQDVEDAKGQRRARGQEESIERDESAPKGTEKAESDFNRELEAEGGNETFESVVAKEQTNFLRRIGRKLTDADLDPDALERLMSPKEWRDWSNDVQDGRHVAAESKLDEVIAKAKAGGYIQEMRSGISWDDIVKAFSGFRSMFRTREDVRQKLNEEFPDLGPRTKTLIEHLFGRKAPGAENRVGPVRRGVEWLVAEEREYLVNKTKEGTPARDKAVELREHADVGMEYRAEAQERTIRGYTELIQEVSQLIKFNNYNKIVGTGPNAMPKWKAMWLGHFPPSEVFTRDIAPKIKRYLEETYDVAVDLDVKMADGSSMPKRGNKVFLPQVLSRDAHNELRLDDPSEFGRAVIEATKAMPENKGIPAEKIEQHFRDLRDAHSDRLGDANVAERRHNLEFQREITMPEVVEGRPWQEPNARKYFDKHYEGAIDRIGFAKGFEGKDLVEMRREFTQAGGTGRAFDEFIRAAQGQRPRYDSEILADAPSGGPLRNTMAFLQEAYNWYKTLKLTASAIPNLIENAFGPGAQYFGHQWYKGVAKEAGEFMGLLKAAMKGEGGAYIADAARSFQEARQFVMNRTTSHHSAFETGLEISRTMRGGIAKVLYRWANRLGERAAYTNTLDMFTDIARLQGTSANRKKLWQDAFQLTDAQVERYFSGEATKAEIAALAERASQVMMAAAQTPYSGQVSMRSPVLRALFMFQSYATKQLRTTIRLADAGVKDWTATKGQPLSERIKALGPSATNFGVNTLAQGTKGLAYMAIMALTRGDTLWGDDSKFLKDLMRNPLGSAVEAWLYGGVFGPWGAILDRVLESDDVLYEAVASTGPYAMANEAQKILQGRGMYKDQGDLGSRIATFVSRGIPSNRVGLTLLGAAGVLEKNLALENGRRGYFEYLRAKGRMGGGPGGGQQKMEENHAAMRRELREAVKLMETKQEPTGILLRAIEAKGEDARRVAENLESRRYFTTSTIPAEEMGEFRDYVGDDDFQAMLEHDAILTAWAKAIRDNAGDTIKKPKAHASERQKMRYEDALQKQYERLRENLPKRTPTDELYVRSLGLSKDIWSVIDASGDLKRGDVDSAKKKTEGIRSLQKLMKQAPSGPQRDAVEAFRERFRSARRAQ